VIKLKCALTGLKLEPGDKIGAIILEKSLGETDPSASLVPKYFMVNTLDIFYRVLALPLWGKIGESGFIEDIEGSAVGDIFEDIFGGSIDNILMYISVTYGTGCRPNIRKGINVLNRLSCMYFSKEAYYFMVEHLKKHKDFDCFALDEDVRSLIEKNKVIRDSGSIANRIRSVLHKDIKAVRNFILFEQGLELLGKVYMPTMRENQKSEIPLFNVMHEYIEKKSKVAKI